MATQYHTLKGRYLVTSISPAAPSPGTTLAFCTKTKAMSSGYLLFSCALFLIIIGPGTSCAFRLGLCLLHFLPNNQVAVGGPVPQARLASLSAVQEENVFLYGKQVSVTVVVSNVGTAEGYLPFVDFFLPAGTNTSTAWLSFESFLIYGTVSMDSLSYTAEHSFTTQWRTMLVANSTITIAAPECVDHPFAVDSNGLSLQVCGYTGDFWVSILLPFDLLSPGGLAPWSLFNSHFDPSALFGSVIPIYCRAGFFGGAGLNASRPSILSDVSSFPANWTSGCSSGVVASLIQVGIKTTMTLKWSDRSISATTHPYRLSNTLACQKQSQDRAFHKHLRLGHK